MAVGKRSSTNEPLTEHDVAARLDKAALRVLQILMEIRQLDMMDQVKASRYTTNAMDLLANELATWGFHATDNPTETGELDDGHH